MSQMKTTRNICIACERVGVITLAHYLAKKKLKFSSGKRVSMYLCFEHMAEKSEEQINDCEIINNNAASKRTVINYKLRNKR